MGTFTQIRKLDTVWCGYLADILMVSQTVKFAEVGGSISWRAAALFLLGYSFALFLVLDLGQSFKLIADLHWDLLTQMDSEVVLCVKTWEITGLE